MLRNHYNAVHFDRAIQHWILSLPRTLGYTMGTRALTDIYTLALRPAALGQVLYISGKVLMPMVLLLHMKANLTSSLVSHKDTVAKNQSSSMS